MNKIIGMVRCLLITAAIATVLQSGAETHAESLSTAFTYQGQLMEYGEPANGAYDMTFSLYDAEVNGTQLGLTLEGTTDVNNGLFTVWLDFGTDVFDGDDRWLEICVGTNSSPELITLDCRQPITPTPYAMTAGKVTGPVDGALIVEGTILAGHLADHSITASQLAPGAAAENLLADGQSAVPMGGVVLSDDYNDQELIDAGFVKLAGGAVNIASYWEPRLDGLGPSEEPVPSSRSHHTAVWTGSEMIIWGGGSGGGRYDPAADSWTPISSAGEPSARSHHTAVWTGSEMIIWGGGMNDGGRYDPVTDQWKPVSTVGAPYPRYFHTAVWTGNEMIIWGGYYNGNNLGNGALYNPASDSWRTVSYSWAPAARSYHTAIWTGSEMIIWGGYRYYNYSYYYYNDGGRYDPESNTWTTLTTSGAPDGRRQHSAVWTGSKMIIWGGKNRYSYQNGGGLYDPIEDSWMTLNTTNAPLGRVDHATIWTDNEMIIWGGYRGITRSDGGRYNPEENSWLEISHAGKPLARDNHTAVWTGNEMIVWGGHYYDGTHHYYDDGGRYNPVADTWTIVAGNPVVERARHTAVWTGSEMIIWGGDRYYNYSYYYYNDGGRYDPVSDSWTPTSAAGTPSMRTRHTAVWTGNKMIIWGGHNSTKLNDGGQYDPIMDSWTPTSNIDVPAKRNGHTAVWTGNEMIIWGGRGHDGSYLQDGGLYDPASDSWNLMSVSGTPEGRCNHSAVWTGDKMVVWGGEGVSGARNDGGLYNPSTDGWAAMPPSPLNIRQEHTAIWTGSEMIVWGGYRYYNYSYYYYNDGARYTESSGSWSLIPSYSVLNGRAGHTAVWTGDKMIVYGGLYFDYSSNSYKGASGGGIYNPADTTWKYVGSGAGLRVGHTAVWTGDAMLIWGGVMPGAESYYTDTFVYFLDKVLYYYQKL